MGKYIYESHLGGLYTSEHSIPWDELYCEQCGDSDWELGYCTSREEARELLKLRDLWADEYIKEFLEKEFPTRRR